MTQESRHTVHHLRRAFGAADDRATKIRLPSGEETVVSEEEIVNLQIRLARLSEGLKVLEVGCGSGYLCARLVEIVGHADLVFGIDISPNITEMARHNLEQVGIRGVHLHTGNGLHGYPESTGFDRIILSCAVFDIPWRLVQQLVPGGIMVIPLERGWPGIFDGWLVAVERLGSESAVRLIEVTSALFMVAEGQSTIAPLLSVEAPAWNDGTPLTLLLQAKHGDFVHLTGSMEWKRMPVRFTRCLPGFAQRRFSLLLSLFYPQHACFLQVRDQPSYQGIGVWQANPFGAAILAFSSELGVRCLGEMYTLGDGSVQSFCAEIAKQAEQSSEQWLQRVEKVWTPDSSWRVI